MLGYSGSRGSDTYTLDRVRKIRRLDSSTQVMRDQKPLDLFTESRVEEDASTPLPSNSVQSYPADPSEPSFLTLAGELRNEVYRYLFPHGRRITFKLDPSLDMSGFPFLRTCKQIHEEAASFFYSSNRFFVEIGWVIKLGGPDNKIDGTGTSKKRQRQDYAYGIMTSTHARRLQYPHSPHDSGYTHMIWPPQRYHRYLKCIETAMWIEYKYTGSSISFLEKETTKEIRYHLRDGFAQGIQRLQEVFSEIPMPPAQDLKLKYEWWEPAGRPLWQPTHHFFLWVNLCDDPQLGEVDASSLLSSRWEKEHGYVETVFNGRRKI